MNIYVSNLSYDTTEAELRKEFELFGMVLRCRVVMDRETGRSRGFGFVEMANQAEGEAAIKGMSGFEMRGRALKVAVAQERKPGDRPASNTRRRA